MGGRRQRGFTLLELMMAIAVMGVILAIAVPSFREFRMNNRMTGAANDLLAAFNGARSEAIKRQLPVGLCASTNAENASPTCTGAITGGTGIGWFAWVDQNRDGVADAGEEVVVRHTPLDAALALTSNWSTVSYAATGFVEVTPALTSGAPASMLICDERGNEVLGDQLRRRILTVTPTGRPGIVRDQAGVTALAPFSAVVVADCP